MVLDVNYLKCQHKHHIGLNFYHVPFVTMNSKAVSDGLLVWAVGILCVKVVCQSCKENSVRLINQQSILTLTIFQKIMLFYNWWEEEYLKTHMLMHH